MLRTCETARPKISTRSVRPTTVSGIRRFSIGDLWGEEIAAATHGNDHLRPLRVRLDLAAQTADLDVDRAIEGLRPPAMREIQQLLAAQDLLGMLGEGDQKLKFAGTKVDHEPLRGSKTAPRDIERPAIEAQDLRGPRRRREGCATGAAEDRADARQSPARAARLRQVIIR